MTIHLICFINFYGDKGQYEEATGTTQAIEMIDKEGVEGGLSSELRSLIINGIELRLY